MTWMPLSLIKMLRAKRCQCHVDVSTVATLDATVNATVNATLNATLNESIRSYQFFWL